MLGTGLDRPLDGNYLHAVETVAAAGVPTVAVDIPTGLNGTSGEVMGAAVTAELTVTFVGLKQGLYLGVGPDYAGEIRFEDLGVPPAVVGHVPPAMRIFSTADLAELLPPRAATAHKGRFGHVLVIGGNYGMGGAARLAGEGALRAGAGLVTVATRPENVATITGNRPELMSRGVSGGEDLAALMARATVVALGPGLGQDDWARSLFEVAVGAEQAKVLDADALNLLAGGPQRREDWILTPHPGEAARLLNQSTAVVQADRLGAVRALAERYGGVALLKGRCTLICDAAKLPFVIDRGNPGMASAGMGDVLTGITAGLLAQSPQRAVGSAAAAAFTHAAAGDRAAAAGQRGLIATDLLPFVRPCLNAQH
jgi:NAD(P)H-hydrate epimerase